MLNLVLVSIPAPAGAHAQAKLCQVDPAQSGLSKHHAPAGMLCRLQEAGGHAT